jgi:UTP--glucose-1-phosphate uridylyltransferase
MSVSRAVILAAGYGTRMLPATKAIPKELLPLVDMPVIEYIVDELVQSGIEHLILVTSSSKRAVEDHFGRAHELEYLLEAKGDSERLARVRRSRHLADISFVRQHELGGIAHAVMTARRAIGDQPFVLVLPDDVIVADPPATRQLLDVFDRVQASVVCVEPVPEERVSAYGVIAGEDTGSGVYRVSGLVEKPRPEEAPSNLAIVGRYVFTSAIFDAIEQTSPGAGGELQITDAMANLLTCEPLFAATVRGRRYDTGQPISFMQAGIELMLQHDAYGGRLAEYLRQLMESELFRAAEAAGQKGP